MVHITQFLARLKMAQLRQAKTITLSIAEANGLHNDLTELLLHLREFQLAKPARPDTSVDLVGGDFGK